MNTPDHPDFTALALGEHIHGTPARAVLDALRTSVAARQEAEHIRVTAAKLSLVLKGQPPQRLDHRRRNEVLHADAAAVRARFLAEERAEAAEIEFIPPPVVRRRRTWVTPALSSAAVAAAAVLILKLLPAGGSAGPSTAPVTAESDDPSGRILVQPVRAEGPLSSVPGAPALPEIAAHSPPVPPQETPAAPTAELPAEVLPQPPPAKAGPVLEPLPTRPPWRPNPRDYAAPPRVK
jgi:hypothetical protein